MPTRRDLGAVEQPTHVEGTGGRLAAVAKACRRVRRLPAHGRSAEVDAVNDEVGQERRLLDGEEGRVLDLEPPVALRARVEDHADAERHLSRRAGGSGDAEPELRRSSRGDLRDLLVGSGADVDALVLQVVGESPAVESAPDDLARRIGRAAYSEPIRMRDVAFSTPRVR